MYAIPNVFDRNAQGKSSTVFFSGGYMNRKGCYNKDGVSDVIKALILILLDRETVKYNSSDPTSLTRRKAEIPLTIQDSIMRIESTIFPVGDLTERLNQLDFDPKAFDDVYVGTLELRNGQVEFKPTYDKPIRSFPHKDNKLDGLIEIFQMPQMGAGGKPFHGRYISGIDPYDNDQADSLSLGSIFILDTWTDEIVAEYTGRPLFADDFYEICRRMLLFYNAQCNYENNKKGLFSYFSRMNSLYLLTDTLEYLRDKLLFKGQAFGNSSKGTVASQLVNAFARTLVRNWLLKPYEYTTVINGEEVTQSLPQLFKLRNRALILELTLWNADGNFDRISCLGMAMLLREEKVILAGGDSMKRDTDVEDRGYIGNDSFFSSNYDDRFIEKERNLF